MQFGISALHLSNGTILRPPLPGIFVIVGPNNAGKSALLRDIFHFLNGQQTRWTNSLEISLRTSVDEIDALFAALSRPVFDSSTNTREQRIVITGARGSSQFDLHGFRLAMQEVSATGGPGMLGPLFVRHLDAEGRLAMTNPGPPRNVAEQATHPLHILWDDIEAEKRLSKRIKLAFGTPVSINRFTQQLQLLIGEPAENIKMPPSKAEIDELLMRPPLDAQNVGDGIRSFAGTLLHISSVYESVFLIDEPEAFLHPPQARMLGRAIADMTSPNSQVFVATHSAEMLEGLLTATTSRDIAVVRLSYGDVPKSRVADVLPATRVKTLWTDPVIRTSGALDALFAPATVICEGDSDVRFYSAALEDLATNLSAPFDTHWMHVGGKARVASMLADLRSFGVKAAAIVDFDIFRHVSDVSQLAGACGLDFEALIDDLNAVTSEITKRGSAPTVGALKSVCSEMLSRFNNSAISDPELELIRDFARPDLGWREAKKYGLNSLELSAPSAQRLIDRFAAEGVFIVPVGALEGWYPNSGAKNGWVIRALEEQRHRNRPENLERFLSEISSFTLSARQEDLT